MALAATEDHPLPDVGTADGSDAVQRRALV
jgi:hypothetical protein